MAEKDLYQILGVDKKASRDEIRKAYRRLARQYHPDLNPGDESAEARFKEASAAHEILADEEKRKLYDEFGPDAARIGFDPQKARAYREWQQQGRPAEGFGGYGGGSPLNLEDLFEELFRGRGESPFRSRATDLEAEIAIDFQRAALGGEEALAFRRSALCTDCSGSGKRRGQACGSCHGSGQREATSRLRVRIPAGIDDGQVIRLAGQGSGGPAGPPGDLLVRVRVQKDPHFRRDGEDLELDLPVTIKEGLYGANVEVPTLDGKVQLRIPAGAQSGLKLRLKGKGISAKGRPAGDLYVRLQVVLPDVSEHLLEDARAAVDRVEELYRGDVRAALKRRRR